jgi:hypothetical protein
VAQVDRQCTIGGACLQQQCAPARLARGERRQARELLTQLCFVLGQGDEVVWTGDLGVRERSNEHQCSAPGRRLMIA